MASYFKLTFEKRDQFGNSAARGMRKNGKIPVNYYYSGEENQNLSIDKKSLYQAISTGQHVFEMEMNNETIYAMIKDAQYHPVTEEIIHIDLLRVRRTEKMTFSIPLTLTGNAEGAVEGGIITQVTNVIDIECFPTNVPDTIEVDISSLALGEIFSARDIVLPDDTSLISVEDTTIVACTAPKGETEVEEEIGLGEEDTAGKEKSEDGSDSQEKEQSEQKNSPEESNKGS